MAESSRTPTLDLGRAGEQAALSYYRKAGYRLVARNWRCSLGELDLVLLRGTTLVFCEVKARRGSGLGGPHEAVDGRKQHKLRILAEAFIAARPGLDHEVRFDVASVMRRGAETPSVHVFENAF
jgi:putative endonuclease